MIPRRTALIGGGASGIGFAAAECLASAGHDVILAGRRLAPLEKAAAALGSASVVLDVAVDCPAVVTEVEGSAFRTGEHAFTLDPDDPLPDGFLLR